MSFVTALPVSAAAGSARAESIRANRRRMLDAALRLFVRQGYGATTMQAIARESGMAVQTLYFTFGNKRTILQTLIDAANAGDDEPVPILERGWFRAVLHETDPSEKIHLYVHNARIIYERINPVLEVLRNAAVVDHELRAQWEENQDRFFIVLNTVAESIARGRGLRDDVTVREATDIMFGMLSHDLFQLFVGRRKWSSLQWERWACDTLRSQILMR